MSQNTPVTPVKCEIQSCAASLGLLIQRLIVGYVMFFHGSQKLFGWFGGGGFEKTVGGFDSMGFPMPKIMAALAGGAECFGGILLAIGLFTRPSAFMIFFTMMVASFKVHGGAFSARDNGMEYPLTLGLVALGLLLTGPGKLAVSRLLGLGKAKTLPRLVMS
ncbi:MAG: hypothetical protein CMJ19_15180 [Phycisphaeraceae bacterium]|nr:hypothetical protein [Phycisphaeraceae bacterium]